MYLTIILLIALSMAIGSIPFAYLLCGPSVAKYGSKNIGATNAIRVMGRKYGIMVFILDALKAICAVSIAYKIAPIYMHAALVGVIAGHVMQIFLKRHYGKGVSTFIGGTVYMYPLMIPIFIGGYIMGYTVRKVSSDGSALAVTGGYLGVIMQNFNNANSALIFLMITISMGLVVFAHAEILQRSEK